MPDTTSGQWVPGVPLAERMLAVEKDVRAAIEAEAVASERQRIAAAVERLADVYLSPEAETAAHDYVSRAEVLRIVLGEETP